MIYGSTDLGKHLLRNYYPPEEIEEMRRLFHLMNRPEGDFPAFVAYCYEIENYVFDVCWD